MITLLALSAALAAASGFDAALPAPRFKASAPQPPAESPVGQPVEEPFFLDAAPKPLGNQTAGAVVARMPLAAQLDRQLGLITLSLGGRTWEVGAAGDAAFKHYYLTFRGPGAFSFAPLDVNRLRSGVDITIAP